jgi:hypothetical protein
MITCDGTVKIVVGGFVKDFFATNNYTFTPLPIFIVLSIGVSPWKKSNPLLRK